jgi:integrase
VASIHSRVVADGTKRYDVFYRDPDGVQRTKTFNRSRAAEAFANTTESDKLRGNWIDPNAGKITFKSYATDWLAIQSFDPNTRIQVESRLRVHIFPVLGRTYLRNIRPSTVQAWLKTTERLAERTRRLIFGHILTILNAAVDDELIRKNPCLAKSVRRPKPLPIKVVPWETDAVLGVRDALPERYQIVATLGAGLGPRQGESFGLSPDDIDWLRGVVHVRRQVKIIGSKKVFAPPKYGKEREVPLPESVREWLAAYLVQFPARTVTLPWKKPDSEESVTVPLLVTSRESKALDKNYFNSHIWKPALIKVGIEPTRANGTHALRHFYASVLLDAGENVKALSEYLGHADPGFTLRVYTHLMKASAERTRKAVDQVLGNPDNPSETVAGI